MDRFSVCIDVGGTFTDCLVEDASGAHHIFKASTTPGEFQVGFMDSLELAARHFGLTLADFLKVTDQIVHGSTVSTNALVEGKAAKTGYLCTKGHPDVLTMREAVRKPVFDWHLDFPEPYVSRRLTKEIPGRISAQGKEIEALDEEALRRAVQALQVAGVEAIGVAFLWSIVNNAHEIRAKEIVEELCPGLPVTLSHELNPVGREYRRTVACVIDASLKPIVSRYITKVLSALEHAGYENELLLANCVGGMMPPDDLIARPIFSVMSGPTLAPVAAQQLTAEPDVLVVDMGGTTFDVSAIRDGRLIVSQEATIGYDMLGISKIDVRSVGAGGGSIAHVDAGGMLHVGPQSAGAVPGPGCYLRGGDQPTVTDANVVLGIIDPDNFLGGTMKLDRAAAARVVEPLAKRLGLSLEDAAYTIYTTSNNVMVGAIEEITVKEGINPRDSYLVVGGGATAAHICEIATELGIDRIMIPRFASGLSAYGGLISDIKWEEQRTAITDSDRFDHSRVNNVLEDMLAAGADFLDRAGVPAARRRFEFAYMGRYRYQSWEIEVPLEVRSQGLGQEDLEKLVADFHAMHERIYSVKAEDDVVEFTTWKVRAIGEKQARATAPAGSARHDKPTPASRREVYFRERGGLFDCPIYVGGVIEAGQVIEGPAVIEEPTTTIYLTAGARATMDGQGNYRIELS